MIEPDSNYNTINVKSAIIEENSFLTKGIFNLDEINSREGTNISFIPYENNRTYFKRKCHNHQKYINYNQRKNYQKVIKGLIEKKYGNKLQDF